MNSDPAGTRRPSPVDDEDARSPLRLSPVAQQAVGGPLALPLRGDREQAGRLVDDHEVLVVVHEPERRGDGWRRRGPQLDPVLRPHHGIAPADHGAVDVHAPAGEPLLQPAAGRTRVERAQPLPERQRRLAGTTHVRVRHRIRQDAGRPAVMNAAMARASIAGSL
jgi:hypothetical protein